jgi:excisionase family DNA binding protein
MDEMLDYEQMAKEFNIKKGTLHCWVHQRKIPHIRLGPRFVRFRRSAVESCMREKNVPAVREEVLP